MIRHQSAQPPVSAVIPAHNAEDTISRALNSALAQTYRPLEIVVVDDCSSDRTAEIVESFAEAGVRLVRLPEQRGASGARNAGIAAATGELIAFLDSDDEWLPSKIAKQVALITGGEHFAFVSCASRFISAEGEDLGDLYGWRRPVTGPHGWKSLLARNTIATPSVLARRRDLVELGGFDRRFRICEDQDMWIRLALRGSVGYVDEFLVRVHDRPGSLSRRDVSRLLSIALDIVERHIAEQRARLTASEIRRIRGERLEWLGRAEYVHNFFRGLPTILRSMALGYRPLRSTFFLVSASPPGRWLKQRLRVSRTPRASRAPRAAPPRAAGRGPAAASSMPHPMLPRDDSVIVRYPSETRLQLVLIVDAEEQYDWRLPLSRTNVSVRSMAAQGAAQQIYRRFGIIPTYAVDYPIVSQEAGYRPLMAMLDAGQCELGAQLHAWVTPPHEEEVCERNSYASNLPGDLEHRKLEVLVEAIERRFGVKPALYRAGRYGTGSNTAAILDRLGFDIDCSVVPGASWSSPHAADYSGGTAHPYWLACRRPVLELPVTAGTTGPARWLGDDFYRGITSGVRRRLRLPGIMARTGLLNRVRLSPEGSTLAEGKALTRRLATDGYRVFALSYHTPSLEPGNTPYVRDERDLRRFLSWIEQYLEFFFDEMNGIATTPTKLHATALAHSPPTADRTVGVGDFSEAKQASSVPLPVG